MPRKYTTKASVSTNHKTPNGIGPSPNPETVKSQLPQIAVNGQKGKEPMTSHNSDAVSTNIWTLVSSKKVAKSAKRFLRKYSNVISCS